MRFRPVLRLVLAAFMLLAIVLAAGCSVLGINQEPDVTDVSDSGALFHFKAPTEWQRTVEPGLIALSSGDEPLDLNVEMLDRFWFLVYTSEETSEAPLTDSLTYIVETRAELRGWENVEMGDVTETTVGDQSAATVEATATDANGIDFHVRYYLTRTSSKEVLAVAMAPVDMFDEYAEEIDLIVGERWFWSPTAGSSETSETDADAP